MPRKKPPQGPQRHQEERPIEREVEQEAIEVELARRTLEEFNYVEWKEALDHRRQMGRFFSESFDPGLALVDERGGDALSLFLADDPDQVQAEVRPWESPNERSSFGFIGCFAEIVSESEFIGGTLVLRFDPEALDNVVRDSLRLFRWDAESGTYQKASFSGVGKDGDYVWGRITMPGRYTLIGLNADPFISRTIKALCGARDILQLANQPQRQEFQQKICTLILCAPEVHGLIKNPVTRETLIQEQVAGGWPAPPSGWQPPTGGYGDICDQCIGLDLPTGQLPECELLPHLQLGTVLDGYPKCSDPGWQSVGPENMGGCMFDLAIDPNNNHRVYAASANGGLWRLDWSYGYLQYAWTPLMDQADSLTVYAVAVAPSDSRVIYIADGSQKVLGSSDFGATWVPSNQTFGSVRKLIVDPNNANRILIASSNGFWEIIGQQTNQLHGGDVTDAAMDPGDPSILYIGVRNVGLRKFYQGQWSTMLSTSLASALSVGNFSGLWISVALGRLGTDANRTVAVKFGPRNLTAAGLPSGGAPISEVFVNRVGGRPAVGGAGQWARCTTPSPLGIGNQGDWVNVIAVDSSDNNVMLVGGEELYRTANGGVTWTKVMAYRYLSSLGHEDQHRIAFDLTFPGYVYLANDGGVYRSQDHGATWADLNKGLETVQFYNMGLTGDKAVINAYHWGVLASQSVSTRQWEQIDGGSWEFVPVRGDPQRPSFFYYLGGQLVRRRYPGTGTVDIWLNFGNFTPSFGLAVDTRPQSNTILVGDATAPTGQPSAPTPCLIRRALDGDQAAPTWTIEPGINLFNDPIISIQFARSSPGMAYAASASGLVFTKTPDVNAPGAWIQRGQWQPRVRAMAVNTFNSNHLYIIDQSAVARSIDGGATWQPIMGSGSNKLPVSEFFTIIASPTSGQTIFLAAAIGVFSSPDEGTNWHPLDEGLPNAPVREILWSGGYLYASLHGRGLWRRKPCL